MSFRHITLLGALAVVACAAQWQEVSREPAGARRGSAIRFAAGRFYLWGYMDFDPDLLQEQPLARMPEYDVVSFDAAERRWRNELPAAAEKDWGRQLPLAYLPRTYSGITTGSERTVMRNRSEEAEAVPRPDLNIVFDQVALHPPTHTLYFFTGGLTAAYDVVGRRWRDLRPRHSPPPVLGGSLAYDPLHDEFILFGGGHVAEQAPGGTPRGYTGTWRYSLAANDWMEVPGSVQPPPRMATRLVTDTRRNQLVLFGGDSQTHYLADTWRFDLATRTWRECKAAGGPPPRAGHFTVFDPGSGLVLVGGGYNRADLTDMWAFEPSTERWRRVAGEVPTGFYLSADIDPETRRVVLVTVTRAPGDKTACNVLFPVRATYVYRIGRLEETAPAAPQASMPKRQGRTAPTRTWGSATFDTRRGRILYWGGGHCGYEGSDVEFYDVASRTWIAEPEPPSFPERLWNHGVRPAGVTFRGEPWMDHGRRSYAYDPVADRLILVHSIRLTTGYDPAWLASFPLRASMAPDALVQTPSSVTRSATWSYDLDRRKWSLAGPAPAGLDTLFSTPQGVMGVSVDWPARLNDAGYQLPWTPAEPVQDAALYRFRNGLWERLSKEPGPQNLYEMTSLAYDSRRNQVILHGGGARRDELWVFDLASREWRDMRPSGPAPAASREAVYLPKEDVFLTYGDGLWEYRPAANAWRKLKTPSIPQAGQNRAMVYDPASGRILLVLGTDGDEGTATVYPLDYLF